MFQNTLTKFDNSLIRLLTATYPYLRSKVASLLQEATSLFIGLEATHS